MICCVSGHAQRTIHTQNVYWLRYQNQLTLNERWYTNAEVDNRRFFDPDIQNQLIVHTRLHFKKNRWDIGGGLTYSLIYANVVSTGANRKPLAEVRPVVEVSHDSRAGRVAVQNRIRLDHRFMQQSHDETVWTDAEYIARIRYRLQGRLPLRKNEDGSPLIGLRISNEIMVNVRETLFDQNRVYLASDVRIGKSWSLEAGYILIYQRRLNREDYFLRNVARVSVLHKI